MEDRPTNLPAARPDGGPLKPINEVLLERRATNQFRDEEIPEETLEAILRLALQAPSGYNFQPWRFVVVRDAENRKRLQGAAFGQPKVGQAAAVVIALGMKEDWRRTADEVFREGAERGAGNPDKWQQGRDSAIGFIEGMQQLPVWVTRQTMIAFTALMLAAEAYGYDTAPMEGFVPDSVRSEFGIPEEAEVVALLAVGRAEEPDKPYTGRLPLERVVYSERFGQPWGKK